METEIWKDIPGYEGKYQVSNMGNVRSLNYNKSGLIQNHILQKDGWGYYRATLSIPGKQKKVSIHRLVVNVFIGIPEGMQINHIDGNKENNKLSNLEICTGSENVLHSFHKLGRKGSSTGKFGELHHNSKKAFQYTLQGELVAVFGSRMEAFRLTGISNSHIGDCIKGVVDTAGGFIWKDH